MSKQLVGELSMHGVDNRTYTDSDKLVDNSLVGIEVEVERAMYREYSDSFLKYWRIVEDPSLRDEGCEFVLRNPYSGHDLISALDAFKDDMEKYKDEVVLSERTSVHIHIDVRDLDYDQLINFVCLYLIFEGALFNIAGQHRKENIFCLPLNEANAGLKRIGLYDGSSIEDYEFSDAIMDMQKYSACNLHALRTHGSLEFRGHEGTVDADRILNWVNLLLCLKDKAKEELDIPNIFTSISVEGVERFLGDVFGDYAYQLIYPDLKFEVIRGIRTAQDIINSVTLSMPIEYPEVQEGEKSLIGQIYYDDSENVEEVLEMNNDRLARLNQLANFNPAEWRIINPHEIQEDNQE